MLHFREAGSEDALAVATLHAESWRSHYRGAYLDAYLDGNVVEDRIAVWQERFRTASPDQLVVLAEEEGRLLGFACAYGHHDAQWGTLLDNLHVRSECQGRGTGARLVSEVGDWCRANHADCGLYLWVLAQNHRARRFYERLGASDRGGEVSTAPGGGQIHGRRYAWTTLSEITRTLAG